MAGSKVELIDSSPIAIVGAGAIAQTLGRLLHLRGQPIAALASRTRQRAESAARFIDPSVAVVALSEVPGRTSRVLVAVSDDAIEAVANALSRAGMRAGTVLHTCGAKGPEALEPLRGAGVACGMLHPLQTVVDASQGLERLQHITFGVAGDGPALEWARRIVECLESRALSIAADRLSWYHAAAVLGSNALVAALDAATILMHGAGVERDDALGALGPLSRTSLDNVLRSGPAAALTGPVVRGDARTIRAHLAAVADASPSVDALYRGIARHLVVLAQERGLSDSIARTLVSMLDGRKGGWSR